MQKFKNIWIESGLIRWLDFERGRKLVKSALTNGACVVRRLHSTWMQQVQEGHYKPTLLLVTRLIQRRINTFAVRPRVFTFIHAVLFRST